RQLEDGVSPEGIVVVLVFVASEDAVQAGAEHLLAGVLDQAGVVQGGGELRGEAEAFIELADREQAGVGGQQGRGGGDRDGKGGKSQRRRRSGVYTHGKTSGQGPR